MRITTRSGFLLLILLLALAPQTYSQSQEKLNEPTIDVIGINPDGEKSRHIVLRIEENLSTSIHPVLPYVFFDDASATLPERYELIDKEKTRYFKTEDLVFINYRLDIYNHLLNIVGRRMTDIPDAKLIITGCNADIGKEKGNIRLSSSRADVIKNYLINNWSIAPKRLSISSRNLPVIPSNGRSEDGQYENRRVELFSDNPEILSPLTLSDTARSATPPVIRFVFGVKDSKLIKSWEFSAVQNGKEVYSSFGTTFPEYVEWSVDKELKEERRKMQKLLRTEDSVYCTLKIRNADGSEETSRVEGFAINQVTIRKKRLERIADKEYAQYSLILFEFGQYEPTDKHTDILEFIKRRLKQYPDATVEVLGYTDRIGSAKFNQKLSTRRAHGTCAALGLPNSMARGLGESVMLYDNNLPEGRFYSRTVDVIFTIPIKYD